MKIIIENYSSISVISVNFNTAEENVLIKTDYCM